MVSWSLPAAQVGHNQYYQPTLLAEVMGLVVLGPGNRCVDAAMGNGSHAIAILKATPPDGKLLGIDADRGWAAPDLEPVPLWGHKDERRGVTG